MSLFLNSLWYNRAEFEAVYEGLFSGNVFYMRWAVDRITIWESRSTSSLDIGIDATTAIVRALIQDDLYESKTTVCQPPDIRLLFATAIIRFVNIISEVAKCKSIYVKTLLQSAKEMGVPCWIVSVRNQATHGRMPSINMLRRAAQYALQWLKEKFWDRELLAFIDFTCLKQESRSNMHNFISNYQSNQFELLFGNSKTKSGVAGRCTQTFEPFIKFVQEQSSRHDFFEVLLQPGFFFPSLQDLLPMLRSRNEEEFAEETKKIDLPSSLQDFWMPLILLLARGNYLQEFVEALFKHLNSTDLLQKKVAACWIFKLIYDNEEDSKFVYKKIPEDERPSFNWIRLLGACVQNCCDYTPALLPVIVNRIDPPLSPDRENAIMALVAIYLGATSSPDSPTAKQLINKNIFTVNNIKEDLKLREEDRNPVNVWHQCPDDDDWSQIPLGYVFGSQEAFVTNVSPVTELADVAVEADETPAPVENAIRIDDEEEPPTETMEPLSTAIVPSRIHIYPTMLLS